MKSLMLTLTTSLMLVTLCDSHKILVIFPIPFKSHIILGDAIVKLLLRAGHEVTYITTHPFKNNNSNLEIIELKQDRTRYLTEVFSIDAYVAEGKNSVEDLDRFFPLAIEIFKTSFEQINVQRLIKDPNKEFDLVISEWCLIEFNTGYAATYNCPMIWFFSLENHWMLQAIMDKQNNPAYNPDVFSIANTPLTFIERVSELWRRLKSYATKMWYFKQETKAYEESFLPILKRKGKTLPPYDVIRENASLTFFNSHVSIGRAITYPRNIIPIAGFHIDSKVPLLPEDLQEVMDKSTNGVIYFSMGSILKSQDFPERLVRRILKMFSTLKQTVIWKFETDIDDVPANVHIINWAPQQSILSHKKCILFVSHGGLLSTIEAIHFGVPMVCIPIFGDQYVTASRSVKKGFAKQIQYDIETLDNNIKDGIQEVLGNPSYTDRVKELSIIYHHRPVPPATELVHWVEHVIATRGATHLRSSALMVPWYQMLYLDLILCIIMVVFVMKIIVNYFCYKKVSVLKKNN